MTKIVKGKHCTILWHVDDMKMSHVDSNIVSSVLNDIDTAHGNIEKTTIITRGKIHIYLGITINYSFPGKAISSMVYYIGKILNEILEDMRGESETTTAHHLFDIVEDVRKLPQTNTDLFHHFVAQILYLSKQAQSDIPLAVSLLWTRERDILILMTTITWQGYELHKINHWTTIDPVNRQV